MAAKKTIAIIGASRGLGLALAQEYCARAWNVIATARGKSAGWTRFTNVIPQHLRSSTSISWMLPR
jgi:NAD(P)-dependent dehydrogenase (short-subunit alcohol dehydrogenase family)